MSIDENEVLIIGRIGRIEKPKKKGFFKRLKNKFNKSDS